MKKLILCACLLSVNAFAASGDRETKETPVGKFCVATKVHTSGKDKELTVKEHSCSSVKVLSSEEAKVSLSERKSKH